jgi:sugar phosphate isomerase/epimerase
MPGILQRIGIDLGASMRIEEALEWAGANAVPSIDVRIGDRSNPFGDFDPERIDAIRRLKDRHGVHLALHTLSAVNTAEFAPFLSDAVDSYLETYVDLAGRLDAAWVVVHAGYHFTDDFTRRRDQGLARLARLADRARARKVPLLLENMNPGPVDAEVHYLAHDVEECRYYFERLDPEVVRWSFTANHAHMLPIGIAGFFEAFGADRLGEVRLADNRGGKEEHLRPGEGTIDFPAMFAMIEGHGFTGPYTLAFGTPDDMLEGRRTLAALAGDRI